MQTYLKDFGVIENDSGFRIVPGSSDGLFKTHQRGVELICATGDGKVELIGFEDKTLAYVLSGMGYPAYYPVFPIEEGRVEAVLMDLDGTTVRSEEFWIWIIERTVASLLDHACFELEQSDIPFVSGHSVSEHLQYCINKYCPEKRIEDARALYFMHTNEQMRLIMEGKGKENAFRPNEGIKDFLVHAKERGIKLGLVTSGLYEKAFPEILSAFRAMQLGDPSDFYDSIITAGYPLKKGSAGTLGELEAKPHPWLYAESFRVGLGIQSRSSVIGIEDSGAGVCSIRLAGIRTVGISGGNIIESGTKGMCNHYCHSFEEVRGLIK